jgi:hypothetical protein
MESSRAMRYLDETAAASNKFGIDNRNRSDSGMILDGNPRIENVGHEDLLSLIEAARLNHVDVIYRMPWFTRMWIVQEVTLASHALLCCGTYEMDWVDFAIATKILMGALTTLQTAGLSTLTKDFDQKALWRAWKS